MLFCGFFYQAGRLTLGPQPAGDATLAEPETLDFGMAVMLAAGLAAVLSAFYLPAPLLALIRSATRIVWEGA